jgi:hypothetical protein
MPDYVGRHLAFGIDVTVEGLPCWHAVEEFDAAHFDQPVAAQSIEAGGFSIENDFAHQLQPGEPRRIVCPSTTLTRS